jgi:hypothetical protein
MKAEQEQAWHKHSSKPARSSFSTPAISVDLFIALTIESLLGVWLQSALHKMVLVSFFANLNCSFQTSKATPDSAA